MFKFILFYSYIIVSPKIYRLHLKLQKLKHDCGFSCSTLTQLSFKYRSKPFVVYFVPFTRVVFFSKNVLIQSIFKFEFKNFKNNNRREIK